MVLGQFWSGFLVCLVPSFEFLCLGLGFGPRLVVSGSFSLDTVSSFLRLYMMGSLCLAILATAFLATLALILLNTR